MFDIASGHTYFIPFLDSDKTNSVERVIIHPLHRDSTLFSVRYSLVIVHVCLKVNLRPTLRLKVLIRIPLKLD